MLAPDRLPLKNLSIWRAVHAPLPAADGRGNPLEGRGSRKPAQSSRLGDGQEPKAEAPERCRAPLTNDHMVEQFDVKQRPRLR